jgi:hypothetical protein
MASATIVNAGNNCVSLMSNNFTTFADSGGSWTTTGENFAADSKSRQVALDWAQKLQEQLSLVALYSDLEDVPSSSTIDEIILKAPRRRAADPAAALLAEQIAEAMYSTHIGVHGPVIQYEKDLIRLRRLVTLQRKRTLEENIKRRELISWIPRMMKQGAWNSETDPVSLIGPPSLPMPVEIAEPVTLAPFLGHLAQGGSALKSSTLYGDEALSIEEPNYNTPAIEFERGVVYSDGRMDLCKMVLGPNNISALMESLSTSVSPTSAKSFRIKWTLGTLRVTASTLPASTCSSTSGCSLRRRRISG